MSIRERDAKWTVGFEFCDDPAVWDRRTLLRVGDALAEAAWPAYNADANGLLMTSAEAEALRAALAAWKAATDA